MSAETRIDSTDSLPFPVTKSWLETLIRCEYNAVSEIKSFKSELIGDKKGFLSNISKLDLEYTLENEKLPKALIIKVPTDEKLKEMTERTPEIEEFYNSDSVRRAHNTEVKFYKLMAQNGGVGCEAPIPLAKCLYAEEMAENGEGGLIILEFVEGKSISFNEDFTSDQIWNIVKHIAALHAFSITTCFHRNFGCLDKSFYGPSEKLLTESFVKIREAYASQVRISDDQIRQMVENVGKTLYKLSSSSPEQLGYMPVVVFGDSQPNNILFEVTEDGLVDSKVAAFLDFQFVHQGSCVYDLCSILVWGVDHKDFEDMSDKILTLYQETLSNLTGGKTIMSYDELKKEFDDFYPLFLSIFVSWFTDPQALRDYMGIKEDRIVEFIERIKHGFGLA